MGETSKWLANGRDCLRFVAVFMVKVCFFVGLV